MAKEEMKPPPGLDEYRRSGGGRPRQSAAGRTMESPVLRGHRHADRRATARGSTREPRSAGRPWSGCLPPSSSARAAAIFSSRRWRSAESRVDDAPFVAVELDIDDDAGRAPAALPHQCGRLGRLRSGPRSALRSRRRTGGLATLCPCSRATSGRRSTRALYYDLVDLGEEREVDGTRDVRRGFGRRILCYGPCRAFEGHASDECCAGSHRRGHERREFLRTGAAAAFA